MATAQELVNQARQKYGDTAVNEAIRNIEETASGNKYSPQLEGISNRDYYSALNLIQSDPEIRKAVQEGYQARQQAKSAGMSTEKYQEYLAIREKQLGLKEAEQPQTPQIEQAQESNKQEQNILSGKTLTPKEYLQQQVNKQIEKEKQQAIDRQNLYELAKQPVIVTKQIDTYKGVPVYKSELQRVVTKETPFGETNFIGKGYLTEEQEKQIKEQKQPLQTYNDNITKLKIQEAISNVATPIKESIIESGKNIESNLNKIKNIKLSEGEYLVSQKGLGEDIKQGVIGGRSVLFKPLEAVKGVLSDTSKVVSKASPTAGIIPKVASDFVPTNELELASYKLAGTAFKYAPKLTSTFFGATGAKQVITGETQEEKVRGLVIGGAGILGFTSKIKGKEIIKTNPEVNTIDVNYGYLGKVESPNPYQFGFYSGEVSIKPSSPFIKPPKIGLKRFEEVKRIEQATAKIVPEMDMLTLQEKGLIKSPIDFIIKPSKLTLEKLKETQRIEQAKGNIISSFDEQKLIEKGLLKPKADFIIKPSQLALERLKEINQPKEQLTWSLDKSISQNTINRLRSGADIVDISKEGIKIIEAPKQPKPKIEKPLEWDIDTSVLRNQVNRLKSGADVIDISKGIVEAPKVPKEVKPVTWSIDTDILLRKVQQQENRLRSGADVLQIGKEGIKVIEAPKPTQDIKIIEPSKLALERFKKLQESKANIKTIELTPQKKIITIKDIWKDEPIKDNVIQSGKQQLILEKPKLIEPKTTPKPTQDVIQTSEYAGLGLYERTESVGGIKEISRTQGLERPLDLQSVSVSSFEDRIKDISLPLIKDNVKIDSGTSILTLQTPNQNQEQKVEPIQKPIEKQIIKPITKIDIKPIERIKENIRQRERIKDILKEPKNKIDIFEEEKPSSKKKLKKIANAIKDIEVFARTKGEDILIGTAKTKQEAGEILTKNLKSTLSASGFAKQGSRKLSLSELGIFGAEFKPSKKDVFRVTQQRGFRLGTKPEVSKIQFLKKSGGYRL